LIQKQNYLISADMMLRKQKWKSFSQILEKIDQAEKDQELLLDEHQADFTLE